MSIECDMLPKQQNDYREKRLRLIFYLKKILTFASLAFGLCLLFTACSQKPYSKDRPPAFQTRISDSNLKHFEIRMYGLSYDRSTNSDSLQANTRSNRRPVNSERQYEKNKERLRKTAESVIAENSYCREGFWVLDFDLDTRGYFLRGECYDLATEQDRKKFPDTIKFW